MQPNQLPLNYKISNDPDGITRYYMDGRQVSEHEFFSTIWTGSRYVDQPTASTWSRDVPE